MTMITRRRADGGRQFISAVLPRRAYMLQIGALSALCCLTTQSHAYYIIASYQPPGYSPGIGPEFDAFETSILMPVDSISSEEQIHDLDVEDGPLIAGNGGVPMRGDLAAGLVATIHFQKKRKSMLFALGPPPPEKSHTVADAGTIVVTERKRSAESAKPLPETEHVCEMNIRNDYRPKFGHEQNGTRVEIQQDDRRQFHATFVECVSTKRDSCHGIDKLMFTSECVTVYEFRPAGIRVENGQPEFVEGFVKVPIACQCRLRRKVNRILIE